MSQDIRVAVSGAMGNMGQTIVRAVDVEPGMALVAAVDPAFAGSPAYSGSSLEISSDLEKALSDSGAQVLIDFTRPDVGGKNALKALRLSVRPVVGTTGLPEEEVAAIEEECRKRDLAVALISNFSLGMVALRRAAREVAMLIPQAEIIELHHDRKLDAPSGTALDLGRVLEKTTGRPLLIHSVRLPGLLAHHEVIFGTQGQTLRIRHDTLNREAFLPGIFATVRKILEVSGVKRELEELL